MDHKMLKAVKIITILVFLLLLVFFWFYLNYQFFYLASLATFALLVVVYLNIRETIGVKTINILMLPVLLLVSAFFWIYLYVSIFFIASLMVYFLLAVLYVILKESIDGYIDAGKIAGDIQVDTESESRLKTIKNLVIIFSFGLILFLDVFAWIYMNAQLSWAILSNIIIMIFAGYINLTFTARFFIIKKTVVSILAVIIAMIALLLIIANIFIPLFNLVSIPVSIYFFTPELLIFLVLLLLSCFIYINVRRTVDVLKKIKNKPAGLINDRMMRIFNYVSIITIVIIIVVTRMYLQEQAYLSVNLIRLAYLGVYLICLIILLLISTNIMKVIRDIS